MALVNAEELGKLQMLSRSKKLAFCLLFVQNDASEFLTLSRLGEFSSTGGKFD